MELMKDAILKILENGPMKPEMIRNRLAMKFKEIGVPSKFYLMMWQLEQDGLVQYFTANVTTNGVKSQSNFYMLKPIT